MQAKGNQTCLGTLTKWRSAGCSRSQSVESLQSHINLYGSYRLIISLCFYKSLIPSSAKVNKAAVDTSGLAHRNSILRESTFITVTKTCEEQVCMSPFLPLLPPGHPYPICTLQLQLLRSLWQLPSRKKSSWICLAEAHSFHFSEPSACSVPSP